MILTRTSRYALRAVAYIARADTAEPVSIDEIAAALNVPRNYLSKVLNRLSAEGIVESVRGRRGGFTLPTHPARLSVQRVVAPFEEDGARVGCLLHDRPCDPSAPCLVHEEWRAAAEATRRFFGETTVQDLLESAISV